MPGSAIARMHIRLLTSADTDEWCRLRLESLEQDPEAFSSSAQEHRNLTVPEVRTRLDMGRDSFIVGAFENQQLIGMAGFHREPGPKLHHKGRIWGVYVTKANRGQGVGRQILSLLLDRVRGIDGVEQISLSVTSTQTAAKTLYHSLGFELWGREPGALRVNDRLIDEEYLFLRIKSPSSA